MNLTEFRNSLRVDLKDPGGEEQLWTDDELNRCVNKSMSDLSRFLPLEKIHEVTLGFTVPSEDWAAGASAGIWVALANKPIKYASETVKDADGATCVRDTDYYMNYAAGKITHIADGKIANLEACTISYTKSEVALDISSLTDLIRISRVEYPVGNVPQTFVSYNMMEDLLSVTGATESQVRLTEGKHVAIYYKAKHTEPDLGVDSSCPSFLDNTVILAAAAYALFIKALEYEQQVATDSGSARTAISKIAAIHTSLATVLAKIDTALGNVPAVHTLIGTALGKVTTYVADMDTALDAAIPQVAAAATALGKINDDTGKTYLTDADSALDAFVTALALAPTALGKVDTYLAGATESTKALLAQIATDVADLRTAFVAAVDAANTALDGISYTDIATHLGEADTALGKVTTYLEDNTNEDAKSWLTKITTDIASLRTAVNTALTATNSYLDEVDTTDLSEAEALLETGDDSINKINVGDRVPENYGEYSQARVSIANARINGALGFAQEAFHRIDNLRSYIEQAGAWGKVATGFISEATSRITMATQVAVRERVKVDQASGYLAEASARIDNIRSYVEQAGAYTGISDGFISETRERLNIAAAYINESTQRLAIADRYLAEASGRNTSANSYIYEADGRSKMADAFISETASRIGQIDRYLGEADRYIAKASSLTAQIDRYLGEADRYDAIATQNLGLVDRLRAEGVDRRNEAWSIWSDKKQYVGSFVLTPPTQPVK